MSKSDSFFIRAAVDSSRLSLQQIPIDLGFAVDALGKTVLRILNIQVRYDFGSGGPATQLAGPGQDANVAYQLTTQSQTSLVGMTDKSLISSGILQLTNNSTGANTATYWSDSVDLAPQHWTNGYLVGVEQIYLAAQSRGADLQTEPRVEIVLECRSETMTAAASMALALSQQ